LGRWRPYFCCPEAFQQIKITSNLEAWRKDNNISVSGRTQTALMISTVHLKIASGWDAKFSFIAIRCKTETGGPQSIFFQIICYFYCGSRTIQIAWIRMAHDANIVKARPKIQRKITNMNEKRKNGI
jgi:hypothetical protein